MIIYVYHIIIKEKPLEREHSMKLNYNFDTFAKAKNEKLYTVDMQRQYKESRLERRTIYYG